MDNTIRHIGIASAAAGGAALAIAAAPVALPGILLGTLAAGACGYAGSQAADAIDDFIANPPRPRNSYIPRSRPRKG